MAYVEMLKRDLQRLQESKKRTAILPLGSGALATTTYPINREMVKEQLDFDSVSLNSLDGVSDRDFCIEITSALAMLMMHLSRLSEETVSYTHLDVYKRQLQGYQMHSCWWLSLVSSR